MLVVFISKDFVVGKWNIKNLDDTFRGFPIVTFMNDIPIKTYFLRSYQHAAARLLFVLFSVNIRALKYCRLC